MISTKPKPIATLVGATPFLFTTLFVGCGAEDDRLVPVHGKVLYNGSPVGQAEMVFHPLFEGPGWMPVATVASDGSFAASTKQPGDGALAGRYKVTITWYPKATDESLGRNFLPQRYFDVKTSPLEVEVDPQSDRFHLLQLTDGTP